MIVKKPFLVSSLSVEGPQGLLRKFANLPVTLVTLQLKALRRKASRCDHRPVTLGHA
jgi:hypothetical protein